MSLRIGLVALELLTVCLAQLIGARDVHALLPGSLAANPDAIATREDAQVSFDPLENDSGPLDPTTVSILLPPQHATAIVNPLTGYITYTPNAGWNGLETFSYQACDAARLNCAFAQVTARVKLWGRYRVIYNRSPEGDWWSNDPEGRAPVQLPGGGGVECALSPNRRQYACGLQVFDFDDPPNHITAAVPNTVALIGGPRNTTWSPNGRTVVFQALDALSGATLFSYEAPLRDGRVDPLQPAEVSPMTYLEGNDKLPVSCFNPSWTTSSGLLCDSDGLPEAPVAGIYRVSPGSKPQLVFDDPLAEQPSEALDGRIAYKAGTGQIAVRIGTNSSTVLTLDGIEYPRWSPDGRKIAAVAAPNSGTAPGQLVIFNADGSNPTWFSSIGPYSYFRAPAWDPQEVTPPPVPTRAGGKWLFLRRYISGEPGYDRSGGYPMLRRASAEGSGQTDHLASPSTFFMLWNAAHTAFAEGCEDARWSPDGARIACAPSVSVATVFPEPKPQILVMDADGTDVTFLNPFPANSSVAQLDWSPDSSQLAVAARSGADPDIHHKLWVVGFAGAPPRLLADAGPYYAGWPSWSPDGAFIAFTSSALDSTAPFTRWLVRADGSAPASVLANTADEVADRAAWSPEGSQLAFARRARRVDGIWPRIHVADFVAVPFPQLANVRQLTVIPGIEGHAIWSPDGEAIAYVKARSNYPFSSALDPYRIWAVNRDGHLDLPVLDVPSVSPPGAGGVPDPKLLGWDPGTPIDGDLDGTADILDNCPLYASSNLSDTDGDGRGDVCECTDQTGDGRNTVTDLVAINLAIFNPGLVTPLCDGNNDGLCNVSDIVAASVEIFSPTNTSICARQPIPGP
jgi:Tol biopolymer transport system component